MTENKDQKRLVRARMQKTGESYSAARAALVGGGSDRAPYAAPPKDWAALAGMTDVAVKAKTGRTWAGWVKVLDAANAHTMEHPEIAKHLRSTYATVSPWWAQSITVGYERIRGLRQVLQKRDSSFEASKSRTFPVDVSTLFAAFKDARRRKKWITSGWKRIRTSTDDRSMRVDWDDGTQVNVSFYAKGPGKSSVGLQHVKLGSRADVAAAKALWGERFDALGGLFG